MISESYRSFFKSLAQNNNRDWFHENKKAYENDVKKPFISLIEELIPRLQKFEPRISSQPKDALFRINRDIRFSKDKTPYHTIMKAGFSAEGKKSFLPGFYLGISADEVHVGGGLFMVQNPELKKIRYHIMNNSEEFLGIVESKEFKSKLGDLRGDKSKRYDKDLMQAAQINPYIAHKQFYAMADLNLTTYLGSETIVETLMEYFNTIQPLNEYLQKAF